MINKLPVDKAKIILWIHCASRDDELGYNILKPGQDFNWNFRMNVREAPYFSVISGWVISKIKLSMFLIIYQKLSFRQTTMVLVKKQTITFYLIISTLVINIPKRGPLRFILGKSSFVYIRSF